jgi:citrate synthase
MPAEWIDAAEAARRLGVKPATLYAYVSRGLLTRRAHADGRRSLFDAGEIAALRDRTAPARDGHQLSFVSAVTALGADRPYYRGRDALGLASDSSYEWVAEWLWAGAEPATQPRWDARPDAVAKAVAAQRALPPETLPLDRMQLIVTAMAITDPLRFSVDREAVLATTRALVAGVVEALPAVSPRKTTAGTSLAARLWPRLTPAAPRAELVRLLDAALVLLADHELAASTVAARVAASVKADPYAVIGAGLGVVSGPMHGGASLGAERMLAEISRPADAARVIGERIRDGDRIPGFGHAVYKSGDARGTFLLERVRAAAPKHPRLSVSEAVLAELETRGLPAMNVDFAVATMAAVCGMVTGAGELIFALARCAGWIAHALEEYDRRGPLRPRATYAGPPIGE